MADALQLFGSLDDNYDKYYGRSSFGGMQGRLFNLVDSEAAEACHSPLLQLYVELGMHTNKNAVTDKNSQRYSIMRVLRKLWSSPALWRSLHVRHAHRHSHIATAVSPQPYRHSHTVTAIPSEPYRQSHRYLS